MDVLAVSATGAVRTVLGADTVDVSGSAPPLRQPPDEQIRDHIERVRRTFDDLENYWRGEDGATSPLSEGLTGAAVRVDGEWPTPESS